MHSFERAFSVGMKDLAIEIACAPLPWADFLLNPRRLRGSDFLMRWSQGVWSEQRIREAVNRTEAYFALPYGPSGVAPDGDVRAVELYFERLDAAGLGTMKRPDLLIFRAVDRKEVERIVSTLGGQSELPFTPEDHANMQWLLSKAVIAVEAENSLWVAQMMPDYRQPLSPQKRLDGKLGLKKNAVVPTVIVKDEDRGKLREWQAQRRVSIHIWHIFYDLAFGIAFDEAERLITSGMIEPKEQVYQAPGGAVTKKVTYRISYHHAYPLGTSNEEPRLIAAFIKDKNGHVLPYVRFEGGSMTLSEDARKVLDAIA